MWTKWFWIDTGILLALGLVGGLAAQRLGLPLPFMLGSLTLGAAYTIGWSRAGRAIQFPKLLRAYFIGVIGTMIGTRFAPDVLSVALGLWPSFLGILGFVVVAHLFSFTMLRRLGGYDVATATYAGLPGGLIEAVALGEKAGSDVRVLTSHHFARVILVVVTVPLLFLWFGGESVGSSAGLTMENGPSAPVDTVLIVLISAVGILIGLRLKLPAGQLMGPLLLCGALQVSGLVTLHPPGWLLSGAQLVVGAGLGAQFAGVTGRLLLKSFGLSVVTVAGMLIIGSGFAALLAPHLASGFKPLFISFAPGGMTEMALIALSLDASPVIVTAHHLLRIMFAVFAVGWFGRRMARRK